MIKHTIEMMDGEIYYHDVEDINHTFTDEIGVTLQDKESGDWHIFIWVNIKRMTRKDVDEP